MEIKRKDLRLGGLPYIQSKSTDGKAIRSLKAILTQDTMTGREFDQE